MQNQPSMSLPFYETITILIEGFVANNELVEFLAEMQLNKGTHDKHTLQTN